MLLGNPNKFAFLIERISEWESETWKNGIMFVIINGEIYPKNLRTTTFNSEIPGILAQNSAFINPVINEELYEKSESEIIKYMSDEENENYYRFFIPFHEINDSGYRIYIISSKISVKIIVCKLEIDNISPIDRTEIQLHEYESIKKKIIDFFNTFNSFQ